MVIEMNNVVITIARQYGSGGRTIGEMLAKKLNVHYYDKELMKLASDDSGINEALFVNADEKVKSTKLFHIAKNEYHGAKCRTGIDMKHHLVSIFRRICAICKVTVRSGVPS